MTDSFEDELRNASRTLAEAIDKLWLGKRSEAIDQLTLAKKFEMVILLTRMLQTLHQAIAEDCGVQLPSRSIASLLQEAFERDRRSPEELNH